MSLLALLAALFIFCYYFQWIIIAIVVLFAAADGGVLAGIGSGLLVFLLFKLGAAVFIGGVIAANDRHHKHDKRD